MKNVLLEISEEAYRFLEYSSLFERSCLDFPLLLDGLTPSNVENNTVMNIF